METKITWRPHEISFRSYVLWTELKAEWESFSVEMSLPHFSTNVPLYFPGNFNSNLSAYVWFNTTPNLLNHAIPYLPPPIIYDLTTKLTRAYQHGLQLQPRVPYPSTMIYITCAQKKKTLITMD